MNISEPFIRRPIATSLLMGGILLVGLVAWPLLPVASLPQIDSPTIGVFANLPGADPQTMASSVATPLEYQFAQIPGLAQMTSTSTLGQSQIVLQFDLERNMDGAANDVQAAINAAGGQLPHNLPSPPQYRKFNPSDPPIVQLALHSDVLPITVVDDYAESVMAQQISQLTGVGQVQIRGKRKPAVRVQIDPGKIAALGLQLSDVAGVINVASVDAPKGSINGTLHQYTIYNNDQLNKAAPWNDVVIAYKNGAPVRIRDVGIAVDGAEDSYQSAWAQNGESVQLMIFKQPGANVLATVQRIEAALPKIMLQMPRSIRAAQVADRVSSIKASLHEVELTLMTVFALVVMVIFLFLRNAWATIIPGVTVPLALAGTAAAMYLIGFSVDNLSLMALTIAVGFVVDDAIVMLENIYRHIEAGLTPLQAALKGAREIGFTILSISISLVAVFIPLLLMGGIVGRLFREFSITVTLAIAVSAFVALTLSPMMGSLFLHNEKQAQHGRIYQIFERGFDRLVRTYTRGLDFVLAHQRATIWVFLVTLVMSIALYVWIPKGFFPQQDTSILQASTDAPADISFQEMVRRQHQLSDIVASDPDVQSWGTGVGGGPNVGMFIGLKQIEDRADHATADQIVRRIRRRADKVSGATLFMQVRQDLQVGGRFSRTQYQYTLQDQDIDELHSWAPRLLAQFKKLPQLADVTTDQQTASSMVSMVVDRDQAARFGIQPALIDQTLQYAYGQAPVSQYFTQINSYRVILEITPALQSDPSSLQKIYIKSPLTGSMVPLSAFVHYDTQHVASLTVNHQAQFPAVTISFNLAPGVALGDAVNAVERTTSAMGMPLTLTGSFQGTAQAFQDSLKTEPYLILAALVTVYIILGMLYESYIHPLTILSTLPSAGVGALLTLIVFHFELSVIALIGIFLLIGIVKKNGIMMVDFALQAEREQGMAPEAAIRQACLLRFRPIMMTTMAALLGALPLAFKHGTGAELRQPLGFTMAGGLLFSQAMTLFTTPVVYLYLDRLSGAARARRRASRPRGVQPAGGAAAQDAA